MSSISLRRFFLSGVLVLFLLSETGLLSAMTVSNDSASKVAVGVLLPVSGQNRPVFFKILDPRNSFQFTPGEKGPFIVSVANLDTKATTRIEGIKKEDRVSFDGKELKKK